MKAQLILFIIYTFIQSKKLKSYNFHKRLYDEQIITVYPDVIEYLQDFEEGQDKYKTLYTCEINNNLQILQNPENIEKCISKATFHDVIYSKGWDTLYLEIIKYAKNDYYSIGYLEGMITHQKISHFMNEYVAKTNFGIQNFDVKKLQQKIPEYDDLKKVCDLVKEINDKFQIDIENNKDDQIFQEFIKIQQQFQGILDGYNLMNPKNKLTYELLNIINYGGAIDNLKELIGEDDIFVNYFNVFRMLKKNHISNNFQSFIKKTLRGRCTVLIKYFDKKVFLSHTTMDNYSALQRVYKYFKTPDREISFSSYPATISSTDDFFLINNNLLITETSLDFKPSKELKNLLLNDSNYIPEYYKVVASSRISNSAEDWVSNMMRFKGGIYNSQWIAFDLDAFEQNKKQDFKNLKAENRQLTEKSKIYQNKDSDKPFLIVFEDDYEKQQMVIKDSELINEGFFSGFNTGLNDIMYLRNNRYLKIKQLHNSIKNLSSLKNVMGHNEQKIPRFNSISSRKTFEDQIKNTLMFRFDMVDRTLTSGGIDIKITDTDLMRQNQCYARNGPAGKFKFPQKQDGIPQDWNFSFVKMNKKTIKKEEQ